MYEESTELTNQVAPLRNSGLVPSTANRPLLGYTAFFRYIQHLSIHVVDNCVLY